MRAYPGVFRDRTGDLLGFRGGLLRPIQVNRDTSDSSLLLSHDTLYNPPESPLQRFFGLATEINSDIIDLNNNFDTLMKRHKECLRPTFADSADSMVEVNALTESINLKINLVSQKITYLTYTNPEFPDRQKIVANLRTGLMDSYRDFTTKFKIEKQAFSATFGKRLRARESKRKQPEMLDFASLNFGTPHDEQRQIQLRNQQNEEEVEQIARQAEDIRNIFADLATMIHDQGTIIDRIDCCIQETLSNALEAHGEIEKAAGYQQRSRLWICIVVLVVVIVLLFLMALAK
jgi:t-SNARE complex subunit (syntaxin)